MIPPFDPASGKLPPGVYVASYAELETRFGITPHRRALLRGLREALEQFRLAGCRRVYLNGSFVTDELNPNDYDACYEASGMDPTLIDPVFLDAADLRSGRSKQKAKYGGEFFALSWPAATGYNFYQFFQVDTRSGEAKGLIAIDLQ